MNIDLLLGTLDVADEPGIDTFDPRLTDIASLIEKGEYNRAATEAETIIADGIYDIRVIGYFLYGVFLEQGIVGLADLFHCLVGLFQDNWEAVGPVRKREKHVQTSLNWLIKMLDRKLNYEESKKSDVWDLWLETSSSDDLEQALNQWDALRQAIAERLAEEAGVVMDGLMKIQNWLRSFQQLVYTEPEPVDDDEEFAQEEDDEAQYDAPDDSPAVAKPGKPDDGAVTTPDAVMVEGSHHLKILLKKLAAFESLVAARQFEKSAIVADDLNTIMANFDPKRYFPKLFSKYTLLRALHIGDITPYDQSKVTVEWQALQQLYEVDLEHFIAMDADIAFVTPPSGQQLQEGGDSPEEETDDYYD